MKTKEELKVLKTELESLNKKLAELSEDELKQVTGGATRPMMGMANPVAGMPKEQAEAIARELGGGKDMGSWRTMSGDEFMKWWEESNK